MKSNTNTINLSPSEMFSLHIFSIKQSHFPRFLFLKTKMSEFILIGYAVPFDIKGSAIFCERLEMKLPFQLKISMCNEEKEESAEFQVSRFTPRENLADHPHHLLVHTSSKEIVFSNVKQVHPQGQLLQLFNQHLQQCGFQFYTLYDYVSNTRYHANL